MCTIMDIVRIVITEDVEIGSSHHTAIGANSLKHKERYDIITDEE